MLDTKHSKVESNLIEQEKMIINYIEKYNFVRRSTVECVLEVKKIIINAMVEKG